jgi:phenylalanyl-tRNA synthetase beta chain
MGAIHPKILQNLKLNDSSKDNNNVFAFELDLDLLLKNSPKKPYQAHQISPYPPAHQDLAFVFDKNISAGEIESTIQNSLNIIESAELYDVYEGESLGENKISYTFAIDFRSDEKTLTDKDLETARSEIIKNVAKIGGKLRD